MRPVLRRTCVPTVRFLAQKPSHKLFKPSKVLEGRGNRLRAVRQRNAHPIKAIRIPDQTPQPVKVPVPFEPLPLEDDTNKLSYQLAQMLELSNLPACSSGDNAISRCLASEANVEAATGELWQFDLTLSQEEMRKIQRKGRRKAVNVVESEVDSVLHESHLTRPEDLVNAINRATTLELGTELRCKFLGNGYLVVLENRRLRQPASRYIISSYYFAVLLVRDTVLVGRDRYRQWTTNSLSW